MAGYTANHMTRAVQDDPLMLLLHVTLVVLLVTLRGLTVSS